MNNPADMNRDLEQEAYEALEHLSQGIADIEEMLLLAWITGLDARRIEWIAKSKPAAGRIPAHT